MAHNRFTRGFLWFIKNTLNHLTLRLARWGHGPFSLVRHVGRTSGTVYETPIIVARVPEGFVIELTYGPEVNWYRNIVAAHGCTIVWRGRDYAVTSIEPLSADTGIRAFGPAKGAVLRMLRRHEFRLLRESGAPPSR